ncbi:MAG: alpha/beta hydrolase, partial [Paracoccaceae bacterium]
MKRIGHRLSVCLALAILAACAIPIKLAEAPTLYSLGPEYPSNEVPLALQTVAPEILYVTDRSPEFDGTALTGYGFERSASMALGAARVQLGKSTRWSDLVARSETGEATRELLTAGGYAELVRFPATPLPFAKGTGRVMAEPAAAAVYAADTRTFQREIAARLSLSPRKEVIMYIHGFNNDLEDGLTTTASLWHYAGRIGVPISYSWPAGNRGLTAYLKDRESGEYSIFHLKETLRMLAAMPEVRAIHLVAHSRGADVV